MCKVPFFTVGIIAYKHGFVKQKISYPPYSAKVFTAVRNKLPAKPSGWHISMLHVIIWQFSVWNIHFKLTLWIVQPFTYYGTMASADFLQFVVTMVNFTTCKTSRDKPILFPRLPAWFTQQGYGYLLDFVALCQLIRLLRLSIKFLFVRLRFRYCFFSPTLHSVKLASRFRVRR